MALLKRKMCTAQDLVEQFNHKVKEYNDLNLELHELRLDKEKLFNKYNSTSEKLARLELSNRDYEKSRDDYKHTANKQKLELDEKKKHIEQLEFKIKEMEQGSLHLKDEIKKLHQENKISKSNARKATKNQASQTNRTQQDTSLNTDFKKLSSKKPQMRDKNIMTDDVASTGKVSLPMYCSKCENQIEFPPVGQILKIMSSPPPPSLSNQFSPPCSPRSIPSSSQKCESVASNTFEQYFHENSTSSSFDKKMIEKSRKISEESDTPSFMLIDNLNRKINNLERLVKKKKQKQKRDDSCHQTCCPSKNIIVVQLPNEEKFYEYAKRSSCKKIHLKRLTKNQIKLKNNKKFKTREWQVENSIQAQDVKLNIQHGTRQSKKKHKNFTHIDETDLFESPAVLISNSTSNNQASLDLCAPETMQTLCAKSLSTLDANADRVIVNFTNKDRVLDDENENECNLQSSVNHSVLVHTGCHENIDKEANKSVDCISGKVFQTANSECNLSLNVIKKVNNDEAIDLINKNFNDTNLTIESDKSEIIDSKNQDTACKSIEKEEISDQAVHLKIKSKLESEETDSTLLNIRRVSISSATSSEYDELFSMSTICTIADTNSQSDIIKHENKQNSDEELNDAKKSNILKNTCQMNSSAIEKIEVTNLPTNNNSSINNSVAKQMNINKDICENAEENEQSSEDSMSLRCFTGAGKKRGKCGNIIESDDSTEEPSAESNKKKRRQALIAKRQQLISKINNLKRTSKYPTTSKQTGKTTTRKMTESHNDIVATYIPTKKQRVAHVPKDNNEFQEVVFAEHLLQIPKDTCEIQKVESENASTRSKLPKKTKKTSSAEDLPRETKKLKLTNKKIESRQSEDEKSTILDVAKLEPILTDTKSSETTDKDEDCHKKIETNIKENKQDENNREDKEKNEITDENLKMDLLASQTTSECIENCLKTPVNNIVPSNIGKDENKQNEEPLDDLEKESVVVSKIEKEAPVRKLRHRKEAAERPARRTSRRLQENNLLCTKSDTDTSNCTLDIVPTTPDCKKPRKKKKSKANKQILPFIRQFDSANSSLADTAIVSHLNNFLLGINKERKEVNFEYLKNNGKPICEQLSVLFETEPLTADVLSQVSDYLLSISPLDVVALVLVEYASTEYLDDIKCNTTYTPPAPPMTKFEQKLVTLIMRIKEKQPEFMNAVENGLQYKLFRIGKAQEVQIVERLFRILVVLNKIKKDREKVRMLICDALYCFNTRAMNIIHITLSCWSEVFPKHASNNDILVKTIVHIIMSSNVNRPFSKLMPLKRLLADYYGYPNCGFRAETFKEELMDNLKENVPGINTAIILLCKSKGAEWALENIIKGLKKMIVSQVHPSVYDALTLLGELLRPFSSDNLQKSLEEITDQLCEVLAGTPGSHDLQEGIVSCLLSIGGKFTFNREKIARCVLKWHPNQDLRQTTKEKFNSFLKTHTAGWWRKFVQQNFPVTH